MPWVKLATLKTCDLVANMAYPSQSYKDSAVLTKPIAAVARKVAKLTFDYALAAAILGVMPIYGRWIPVLRGILLLGLNLKLARDIAWLWGNPTGQSLLERIGCCVGIASSFVWAGVVWVLALLVAIWLPLVDIVARAMAYGVLTLGIGRSFSHYFYSPEARDSVALNRALERHFTKRDRS